MENNNIREDEIDLLELFKALWQKAWLILLVTVVAGSAVFAFTLFAIQPKYKAEVLMYVSSSDNPDANKTSISQTELTTAKSLVDTYSVILKARTTLNDVIEQGQINRSYEDLTEMVTAEPVNNTEVFSVSVLSTDPNEAAHIANTIADVLPEKLAAIVTGSSVHIVDYADVPYEKDSPSLGKNTLIGAFLGFVIVCGVVVVQSLMDTQIRDSDYLSQTYNIPVLAVIPDLKSKKSGNDYYKSAERQVKKGV